VARWIAIGLAGVIGLAALAGLVVLTLWDWNDARAFIARRASETLGRPVAIDGDLAVGWGNPIRIHVEGLRVANRFVPGSSRSPGNSDQGWSGEPEMMSVRALDVWLRPWPLLRGHIELAEVRIDAPALVLEKNAAGEPNWDFTPASTVGAATRDVAVDVTKAGNRHQVPVIERLAVRAGRVRYRDPTRGVDVVSGIDTASGANGAERVRLDGNGRFAGMPFALRIEGGSLWLLRDSREPYPLHIEATIGHTRCVVDGRIAEPVKMEGVDLGIDVRGASLADLLPIAGFPAPPTRPFALSGHLDHRHLDHRHLDHQGTVWRLEGLLGGVGDSDLSGWLALDTAGERPRITGELVSRRLAAADLAGFIGAAPGGGAYPTKGPGRVLPATPVDLAVLHGADVDIAFRGQQVEAPFAPLAGLDVRVRLDNGRLAMDPLALGMGGGRVTGAVVFDARQRQPVLETSLEFRRIRLAGFFRGGAMAREMGGVIAGRIQLAGHGTTVADILATANGKLGLAVDGGQISALLAKGLKTNIPETLGLVLSGDRPLAFGCLVGDLVAENGVLRTGVLVLDAQETLVTGQGTVDLRNERLDLTFEGRSKSPQIFATHVPVTVRGTLGAPAISAGAGETVARGVAALALGVLLTPLAALVPLLDPGTGEDVHCGQLVRNARAPAAAPAGSGR
jgi:uncharacterized protein involved in outer membrane biogenesis